MPATFIPSITIIEAIASPEELDFINALRGLSEDFEVYYQPVTNINHVDLAILRHGAGLMLVEISSVNIEDCEIIDKDEKEYFKNNQTGMKSLSPFERVVDFKNEFFDTLSIELFSNKYVAGQMQYYGLIKTAVYMPGSSLKNLKTAYGDRNRINDYRIYGKKDDKYTRAFISCDLDWIRGKVEQALRLNEDGENLFTDDIYNSLHNIL